MEVAHLEPAGQRNGVARATDVHRLVHLVRGGHVVDRGQVEEVLDVTEVGGDPLVAEPEVGLTEVTDDRGDPGTPWVLCLPLLDQGLEPVLRARTAHHEDLALAVVDQLLDEVAADETGGSGDEVGHGEGTALARRECLGIHSTRRATCGHAIDLTLPVGNLRCHPRTDVAVITRSCRRMRKQNEMHRTIWTRKNTSPTPITGAHSLERKSPLIRRFAISGCSHCG